MKFLLLGGIGIQELIVIALIVLLLFGAKRIPELMKGIGKGIRSFKDGINNVADEVADKEDKKEEDK